MPTITALEPQQNDAERVNLFIDGVFAFGVSSMIMFARGLRPGQELDDSQIEDLRHEQTVEFAYGAALSFLSFRPRSRRELEDYLRRKKMEPTIVDAALERLERSGLLDDREFARYWFENRQNFRPRGNRALKYEMRQKGIAGDIIDEVLQGSNNEEETAYEAGRKKMRSLATSDEREFYRKMVAFLGRRGYEYDVCATVSKRLWAELLAGK